MLEFAPRYDPRILDAVRMLDDRREPIAEISRRVGVAAAGFGLPKPSYVHLRRLIHDERDRRDYEERRRAELRKIALDVTTKVVSGRFVDAYEVADRVKEAGR